MLADPGKMLKSVLVLLVLLLPALRLQAQGQQLFNKTRTEVGIKAAPSQSGRPSAAGERVPLEGKIDRSSYRLGPGDEVDVSIWGTELYESYHLFVSPGGRLLVPPAGPLEVHGMTLAEAESYLVRRMSEYYSEARISLTLINPRTFRVFAVGALSRPGTYFMSAVDRVSELLTEAGGLKPGGSRRRIRLLDSGQRLLRTLDMMRYRLQGDLEQNPFLVDGCMVEVPPVKDYVLLRGSFTNLSDSVAVSERRGEEQNEYVVEYLPGETLSDLLHLVGGPEEFETAGEGRRVVLGGQSDPQRWIPLTPRMIEAPVEQGAIYEFPVRNKWVLVSGKVNLPGRYVYQPGWTVREYLGQAGGPESGGSEKKCYIKRAGSDKLDCKPDDQVLPGDVIFVPEKKKSPLDWVLGPITALVTLIIIASK